MPNVKPSSVSEEELYANLGRHLVQVRATTQTLMGLQLQEGRSVNSLLAFSAGADAGSAPPDWTGIGKEYFGRISQAAYNVICEGSPAWKQIEDKTEAVLVSAFAGLIMANLALLSAIAVAVATLIVGIFFTATGEEICGLWKKSLPPVPVV